MGVGVKHGVGVALFLESSLSPFSCSLQWSLTSVVVGWFRRDLRVGRVPRGPESGHRVVGHGRLVLLLLPLLLLDLLLKLLCPLGSEPVPDLLKLLVSLLLLRFRLFLLPLLLTPLLLTSCLSVNL